MNATKSGVAAGQVLLILPAALFMGAIVARNLQSPQYEPAHTAQRIVWYSARQWTLRVLLFGLPLAVLVAGCSRCSPASTTLNGRVSRGKL